MTVGDRDAWTSSKRAPCGRFASRICWEREIGLLLYLKMCKQLASHEVEVYLLQRELVFAYSEFQTSLVPYFGQICYRRSRNPDSSRIGVEYNDVRHYVGRNSVYRLWTRTKAAGALASKTAREYQWSHRCALRVTSLRCTRRIRPAI